MKLIKPCLPSHILSLISWCALLMLTVDLVDHNHLSMSLYMLDSPLLLGFSVLQVPHRRWILFPCNCTAGTAFMTSSSCFQVASCIVHRDGHYQVYEKRVCWRPSSFFKMIDMYNIVKKSDLDSFCPHKQKFDFSSLVSLLRLHLRFFYSSKVNIYFSRRSNMRSSKVELEEVESEKLEARR